MKLISLKDWRRIKHLEAFTRDSRRDVAGKYTPANLVLKNAQDGDEYAIVTMIGGVLIGGPLLFVTISLCDLFLPSVLALSLPLAIFGLNFMHMIATGIAHYTEIGSGARLPQLLAGMEVDENSRGYSWETYSIYRGYGKNDRLLHIDHLVRDPDLDPTTRGQVLDVIAELEPLATTRRALYDALQKITNLGAENTATGDLREKIDAVEKPIREKIALLNHVYNERASLSRKAEEVRKQQEAERLLAEANNYAARALSDNSITVQTQAADTLKAHLEAVRSVNVLTEKAGS